MRVDSNVYFVSCEWSGEKKDIEHFLIVECVCARIALVGNFETLYHWLLEYLTQPFLVVESESDRTEEIIIPVVLGEVV